MTGIPGGRIDSYRLAQCAMANLKAAVVQLLAEMPAGLTNSQIGRTLGIYQGHVGHEGHISRTLLAMLEGEGVVQQDDKKRWALRAHTLNEERDDQVVG